MSKKQPNDQDNTFTSISSKELTSMLLLSQKELFNLRFQKVLGELKNTSRFLKVRKKIARIYTELNTRKIGVISHV